MLSSRQSKPVRPASALISSMPHPPRNRLPRPVSPASGLRSLMGLSFSRRILSLAIPASGLISPILFPHIERSSRLVSPASGAISVIALAFRFKLFRLVSPASGLISLMLLNSVLRSSRLMKCSMPARSFTCVSGGICGCHSFLRSSRVTLAASPAVMLPSGMFKAFRTFISITGSGKVMTREGLSGCFISMYSKFRPSSLG